MNDHPSVAPLPRRALLLGSLAACVRSRVVVPTDDAANSDTPRDALATGAHDVRSIDAADRHDVTTHDRTPLDLDPADPPTPDATVDADGDASERALDVPPCLPRGLVLEPASSLAVGARRRYERERVLVGRDARGLYALSAICPHSGCTVDLDAVGFVCPCHFSEFHEDGSVRSGPARRPLDPVALCVREDGLVVVDPRVIVAPDARVVG